MYRGSQCSSAHPVLPNVSSKDLSIQPAGSNKTTLYVKEQESYLHVNFFMADTVFCFLVRFRPPVLTGPSVQQTDIFQGLVIKQTDFGRLGYGTVIYNLGGK